MWFAGRAHWLLAMQLEWQASMLLEPSLDTLGKARQHRCWLETLHDIACKDVANQNHERWQVGG